MYKEEQFPGDVHDNSEENVHDNIEENGEHELPMTRNEKAVSKETTEGTKVLVNEILETALDIHLDISVIEMEPSIPASDSEAIKAVQEFIAADKVFSRLNTALHEHDLYLFPTEQLLTMETVLKEKQAIINEIKKRLGIR